MKKIEQRLIRRGGPKVSAVGFGGIPIQRITEEEGIQIIKSLQDSGINFIDTARGYGKSEEVIGKGLMKSDADYPWFLATKSMARDYEGMKKDIELSLTNLQCQSIDLYQLHNVRLEQEYTRIMSDQGAYRALSEARDKGRIRMIGFTSHDVDMAMKAVESGLFDTIQFPYNIVESQGVKVFEKAHEKGVGVIIMKPLAGGAIDNGEIALKFILNNPHVTVAIPGMDSLKQIPENAGVATGNYEFTREEKQYIEQIRDDLGNRFCRRCGYCGPCAAGINIPVQFLMEGYYSRYDLKEWAHSRYDALDKKASDCEKCGLCEEKCPYDLPIRDMLDEVRAVMEE